MTTINLSVKRPKADGSLDPVRGSAEFSPVRQFRQNLRERPSGRPTL